MRITGAFGFGLGLSASALAVAAYVAAVHLKNRDAPYPTVATRAFVLSQIAQDARQGGALLVGDSVTEMQSIPALCGLRVFNAGISGARVADWQLLLPAMMETLRPRLVVFALGLNDAQRQHTFDQAVFARRYAALVQSVRVPTIVVTPWGIEAAGQAVISPERLALVQSTAAGISSSRHVPAVSPNGLTIDGIHPNKQGRILWRKRLESACVK